MGMNRSQTIMMSFTLLSARCSSLTKSKRKMEGKRCNDFIQECNEFFEHMNIKYKDIIEKDSSVIATKRVKRKRVMVFHEIDYIMQSSPVVEVLIKFNVMNYKTKNQ